MTVDRGDYEWAIRWMASRFGTQLRIEEMTPVPSRLARLHRVALIDPNGQRRYGYLKRFPHEAAAGWTARLAHMQEAASALEGESDLLPFTILAADPIERALLTAELPGRPLSRWHRRAIVSARARATATQAWHGTGRWLGRVHAKARPATPSSSRAADIVGEIDVRLERWGTLDPGQRSLVDATRRAIRRLLDSLDGRPVQVVLCHGDVSPGNILVDARGVGLLDLDDLRLDMPGLDISQARLAIEEFGHLGWQPAGGHERAIRWLQAFARGYGRPLPEGPEYSLPHVRNLVVYLLTLAGQRTGVAARRLATELRYRRLLRELAQTIIGARPGPESWPTED